MRKHLRTYFVFLGCLLLSSCAPRSIREAQDVVAQADSLRQAGQMYGVDEGDSTTLAQAYERLKRHSVFSRQQSEYAHACYHYGRLLREKDDPIAAMQVFIDATHSGTKDYHILGRVYSNMGDLCHLAGEYPLSYDMFERSADMFLQNGDTLFYYYLLNDMAFELAMCADKDGALSLIKRIENGCWDQGVQAKVNETKAELYLQIHQYDSAIYCATISMQSYGITMPTCAIIKAHSFYKLSEMDSALWYANILLTHPDASYQDRFNALYIITHFDSTLCAREIAELSSQREDIRYYEYEPDKEELTRAVQLLEQDLNRKSDLRWLYAIVATILVIGIVLLIYIHRKRRQHQLLSQQIDDMRAKNKDIKQQHEQIVHEHTEYTKNLLSQTEQNCTILIHSGDFPRNIHWKETEALFELIDDRFGMLATKLQTSYHLSEREIRLCILVLLGISNSEQLAEMLHYGISGIRNFKNRTAKKLGTNSIELREILLNIAVGEIQKTDK